MAAAQNQNPDLITYVDSSQADWREFRPGSRRKVLHEDAATGQLTMLVQWDPGYRMGAAGVVVGLVERRRMAKLACRGSSSMKAT